MNRQENIRFSNDPSLGLVTPIRLVTFSCSTLYISALSDRSSLFLIRSIISNRLRLLSDLDRFV